ncbi:MAG TPA: biotin--[acetyl-CoA-carboxylase] ligase [Bacteroidia bacterium]|jgi:BirA family biotin operon repressor/biotin-[acetyl-CoA-carboxylase] ligase
MKTLFVGQNSIHVESTDSTNSYASEMLRQIELSEGTLIYTFKQLKGRGQRGNFWESEPNKNVALSFILHPKFLALSKQFLLTKISSLAVADVMAEMLDFGSEKPKISIKWPNDIYVNDKKIAGILIENTLRENGIQYTIIGIGININQMEFLSTGNAVSMAQIAGVEFQPMAVLNLICAHLEARYLQLKANKEESIDDAYLACLYKRGNWAAFECAGEMLEGRISGVSPAGKLQVEMRNAEIKEFDLKEIRFI